MASRNCQRCKDVSGAYHFPVLSFVYICNSVNVLKLLLIQCFVVDFYVDTNEILIYFFSKAKARQSPDVHLYKEHLNTYNQLDGFQILLG